MRDRVWMLAVVVMIADHIGAFLPVDTELAYLLRVLGRIGLPLWGWLIVDGMKRTSDPWRYVQRITFLAILSMPIYHALTGNWFTPIFTLAVGALCSRMTVGTAILPYYIGVLMYLGIDSWFAISIWAWALSDILEPIDKGYGLQICVLAAYATFTSMENIMGICGVFALFLIRLHTEAQVRYNIPKAVRYAIYPGHLSLILLARLWSIS